MTIYQRLNY